MQIFYLLNCWSLRDSVLNIGLFTNKAAHAGIAALVALQVQFVDVPF